MLGRLVSARPRVQNLAISFCALNFIPALAVQWSRLFSSSFRKFWPSSVLTVHPSSMQSGIFIFKCLMSQSHERRFQTRAVLGMMLKELPWSLFLIHSFARQPTVPSFLTSSPSILTPVPICGDPPTRGGKHLIHPVT